MPEGACEGVDEDEDDTGSSEEQDGSGDGDGDGEGDKLDTLPEGEGVDDSIFPTEMVIDYVRVYQLPPAVSITKIW